ncbi:glycosyltransferase [Opitutales bacterium]|nr:glycosyltransferase [Opitutales bacterium]
MKILKINAEELGGGANQIAKSLLDSYSKNGHITTMGIRGIRKGKNQNSLIFEIPNEQSRNFIYRKAKSLQHEALQNMTPIIPKLFNRIMSYSEPIRKIKNHLGWEDFNYPGSREILDLVPFKPDVIHCHNLHGNFFDLRLLAILSKSYPVFITLHDCWTFTGHCVYPYECEKWRNICHDCPHLDKPVFIERDASTRNQKIKADIYKNSKLFIASPSDWLTKMAKQSILKNADAEFRTINNGVDETLFKKGSKSLARKDINLPNDGFIILFMGSAASKNAAKGFSNLIQVIEHLSTKRIRDKITFLVLGDNFETREFGENLCLKSGGWIHDRSEVVKYYQAADIYIHLANAENFPTTILEAMHCSLPVIASKVGGITEQVIEGKTGYCFENQEIEEIANCLIRLLTNNVLREKLGNNANSEALNKYTQKKMVNSYLEWFRQVLAKDKKVLHSSQI